MMDTTDEVDAATRAASSSATAPAAVMPMEVQKPPGRASPAGEPATKKSRRSAVAAIVDQVLNEYRQPDPEDHVLVYGEGGIVLERSAESLREGRMAEINMFHEKSVVKGWSREEAKRTGAKAFAAGWVDDKFKVKSRYVIKEFAKTKDDTVFAAASD